MSQVPLLEGPPVALPPTSVLPRRRIPGWLAVCIGVVGAFLLLTLLGEAFGGGPSGPASSSYATDAQGLAAWAELLDRSGHPVSQLRAPIESARLDPADTVVVLDPDALLYGEGRRLLQFVRAGGRLVFGGVEPQSSLPALLSIEPRWQARGSERELAEPHSGPTISAVSEVRSAGEGSWTSSAGYDAPLRGVGGEALLLERDIGHGRLELLADASPLQNRLLAYADNAQLALNLVGARGRPVVFVESVHGFGKSRGLAALPANWWFAFAGLVLAGLLWMVARARRLGAAEPTAGAEPPPRSAYTAAIVLLLRRTGEKDEMDAALRRLRDGR